MVLFRGALAVKSWISSGGPRSRALPRKLKVQVFRSFEEENRAERLRRARMTNEERLREFEAIQERAWGETWRSQPMIKTAWWETTDW